METPALLCTHLYDDGINMLNAVERLPDGRLFTLCSTPRPPVYKNPVLSPRTQLVLGRISDDEGKTWGTPYVLYELPERAAAMLLGCFTISASGRIHVMLMRIYEIEMDRHITEGDVWYLRFDGAGGENPVYKKFDCLDRYTGSCNNMIQTQSGRLLIPLSTISGAAGSTFVSGTLYSDDDGDSWAVSNDVAVVSEEKHVESGAVEPVVIETQPGTLVMLIRTVLNVLYYSVSKDEGATWGPALPTKIKSSNAPAVLEKLPGGRIVVSWNNCLGLPMHGTRYSFARQCLHAAYSDDGLRTLQGGRIIYKKRREDPDNVLNCYPFAAVADENEVFLRPFSVQSANRETWAEPAGHLLRLEPSVLLQPAQAEHFDDGAKNWVGSAEPGEGFLLLPSAGERAAVACLSFSYAAKGSIMVRYNAGAVPSGLMVALADCYLDRLNFEPNEKDAEYAPYIEGLYTGIMLEGGALAAGEMRISWDTGARTLALDTGAGVRTAELPDNVPALNHLYLVVPPGAEGALRILAVEIESSAPGVDTGIVY